MQAFKRIDADRRASADCHYHRADDRARDRAGHADGDCRGGCHANPDGKLRCRHGDHVAPGDGTAARARRRGAMRSPEAFVFLAPGTAGPGTANSNNGIFISKIGGGQNFGNDVLLDGSSILRTENGSSFDEAAPSVEAISEFKVLTSTIPAMYGRTTGGIETFTTKSGTNSFHGTAYDILQNEALNANSWVQQWESRAMRARRFRLPVPICASCGQKERLWRESGRSRVDSQRFTMDVTKHFSSSIGSNTGRTSVALIRALCPRRPSGRAIFRVGLPTRWWA